MSLIKTLKDKDGNILYPQSTAEAVFTKTGEKTVQDEIDNFNTVYFGSEAPTDEKAVLWIDSDAPATDVLTTTNRTVYTPIEDYNPATKKYTDDTVATGMEQVRTQYNVLPAAAAENNGKIIQYTGETTENLKKGEFYQLTPIYAKLFETDLEVITAIGDVTNLEMPYGINSDYVANLDVQVLLSKIKEYDTTNILDTVEDYLICIMGAISRETPTLSLNAMPADAYVAQDWSRMINLTFLVEEAVSYGVTLIEGALNNESNPLLCYLNIPVITDAAQEPVGYEWLKIETDEFAQPIYFKTKNSNVELSSTSESGILDYTPAEIDAIYYRLANAYKTNKTIYLVVEQHYMPMAAEVEPDDGMHHEVCLYALSTLFYRSNKQFSARFTSLSPSYSSPYVITLNTNYTDFEQNTLLYSFSTDMPWMEANNYVTDFWIGTQAQYDKKTKNKTTLYLIKEG